MCPNIFYLFKNVLAVLPIIISCEAEMSILLKTSLRATMWQERLTGLALMHICSDVPIDIEEIVHQFAIRNPLRMKLANINND